MLYNIHIFAILQSGENIICPKIICSTIICPSIICPTNHLSYKSFVLQIICPNIICPTPGNKIEEFPQVLQFW